MCLSLTKNVLFLLLRWHYSPMPILASLMDFYKSDRFFDHSLKFLNFHPLISFLHSSTIRFLVSSSLTSLGLLFNNWLTSLLLSEPGSSVGIATDYRLDRPGSNPGGNEIFRPSRPALKPNQPPVK